MIDVQKIRLDSYLANERKDISKSQINKFIKSGTVKVNGSVSTKAGLKINPSQDSIEYDFLIEANPKHKKLQIHTIYEDDNVIVIDKPIGVLSHKKGAINEEDTVAEWALPRLNFDTFNNRTGIVHRLDRATSGVMIIAKNEISSKYIQKQFASRNVKKTYIAVVEGKLQTKHALIDMAIGRNPKKPQFFMISANGKSARTEYEVIKESKNYSMLELKPLTGRTHQLRVHLKSLGHPILGDNFYGNKSLDRLYLHAFRLEITLPTKERKIFEAPLPTLFDKIINDDI